MHERRDFGVNGDDNEMERIIQRIVDMPYGVKACVTMDVNGDYNVYINAHYNREQQEKAVRHELGHILGNDFYNGKPLQEIEDVV